MCSSSAAQAPPDTAVDSTDLLSSRGAQRLSQLLAARVPGLLVSAIPGTAGAGARIRIRGPQTLADNRAPLILVDGIRVAAAASVLGFESAVTSMPRLDDFHPEDVERIEVLAGPAAAGRFGPDAANGVVLRNRLEWLDAPPYIVGSTTAQIYRAGLPVGTYLVSGVSFTDANGDGLLSRDEVVLVDGGPSGSPYPTQGATLSLGMRVGAAVRLSGTLEYRAGAQLANFGAMMRCFDRCRESVDPATPLKDQATVVWSVLTPRFLEDADFLKLRGVSITFNPPRPVLRLLRAEGASITLTGRNLATWTGYSLGDPEVLTPEPAVGGLESIVGRLSVPPLPEWSLHVRLTY